MRVPKCILHVIPGCPGMWPLIFHFIISVVSGYSCKEKCSFGSVEQFKVTKLGDEHCYISMPDNPHRNQTHIFPCQIQVHSNCTGFCNLHIHFAKFTLPKCAENLTNYELFTCDMIDSCEYVVISERGKDQHGTDIIEYTRFDGDMTSEVYESRTDKVLIQFCYRSETFSARNLQLGFKAFDPVTKPPPDYGPPSVYIFISLAVVCVIAIIIINWCPWLKPCLDPPPKKSVLDDL